MPPRGPLDIGNAFSRPLLALAGVTLPMRAAIARLRQFPVRADAGLGVHAPEIAIIGVRHRRIFVGVDVHALPAQRGADIRMFGIEAFAFVDDHARSPFSACRMARLTATCASWILYLFRPRLLAPATAAAAAASAVAGESGFPTSAPAASLDTQGIVATWLMTT